MWLKAFKIALIQEELPKLEALIESMPNFETLQEMEEAAYLLAQANELFTKHQEATSLQLTKLKQNINFLDVTATDPEKKLDIKQ